MAFTIFYLYIKFVEKEFKPIEELNVPIQLFSFPIIHIYTPLERFLSTSVK